MNFGAMNSPLVALEFEAECIARLGFDYLELTMDAPYVDHLCFSACKDSVNQRLNQYGLGMVCHMPTFISLADLTESIRIASVQETTASIAVAKALGSEKVVLHPWFLSGLGTMLPKVACEYGRKSLRTILDFAQKTEISVCLENLFPRSKSLVLPEDFVEWFEEYPDLKMTLDTGHANLAGGTKTILKFIEKFGDRIGHVHVSDNRGRSDDHLPIGAGNIDFPAVVAALKAVGYDETVTFEIFTSDREFVVHSREKFKELWAA